MQLVFRPGDIARYWTDLKLHLQRGKPVKSLPRESVYELMFSAETFERDLYERPDGIDLGSFLRIRQIRHVERAAAKVAALEARLFAWVPHLPRRPIMTKI